MTAYSSIAWVDRKLRLLDQRKIPQTDYIDYSGYREVSAAICDLVARCEPPQGMHKSSNIVMLI